MNKFNQPTICLVYDKITTSHGGAEQVLKALSQAFPNSAIYTAVYNPNQATWANKLRVKTSFLQKLPFIAKFPRFFIWTMPVAIESLDLSSYDIIISVSSAHAKGVLTRANQLHINYMLTPPRYLYNQRQFYLNTNRWTRVPIIKQLAELVLKYLAWWDQKAALRPDVIIPISKLISQRVQQSYNLSCRKPLYPPFDNAKKNTSSPSTRYPISSYLLCLGRLVAYKKFDLAIKAAIATNNNILIVGTGEELEYLANLFPNQTYIRQPQQSLENCLQTAKLRQKSVIFLQNISNEQVTNIYQNAKVLVSPGEEDFGITSLESVWSGTPLIINGKSGATEILKKNIQYYPFFESNNNNANELIKLINDLPKNKPDLETMRLNLKPYQIKTFTSQVKKTVYDEWVIFNQNKI